MTVQELIAKKNYPKALEVLKAELAKRPHDERLRLQYADVLILAGRNKEAGVALMALADQQAADGFAAKAIAVLKRIEKIDPGRGDVEDRLAHLIQQKVRQAPTPSRPAPAVPEFGLEEMDSGGEISLTPSSSSAAADTDEDLAYVAEVEAESESAGADQPFSTPLFEGLSPEELVPLMRGLQLRTFNPGDIVMTEGAPGDSMFILTTGSVKAFVKNLKGVYMQVHEFEEGAFFGEISLLTGKPRTATLTAASPCEALELDKATLDSITKTHPRVREVLKKFQEQRAQDTVTAILRNRE